MKDLGEALGVLDYGSKGRMKPLQLCPQRRITQDLQTDELGILWLRGTTSRPSLRSSRSPSGSLFPMARINAAASHIADMEGKHIAIADAEFLQGLGVVGD